MKDFIRVQIDEDLEDIIPDFLKNRRQDIISLRSLLGEKNYDAIQALGHSMKGAGASYGFQFISNIGKSIEEAARAGSDQEIAARAAELADFLGRIQIEFIRE